MIPAHLRPHLGPVGQPCRFCKAPIEQPSLWGCPGNGQHLGDGVYAVYDSWNVWLWTPCPSERNAIALEPAVLTALSEYLEDLKDKLGLTAQPVEPG